ncbi:NUDIX hydrolase [Cereibacter sp. SYSU M97828]|nr:NUDIX hydrolase [Cereibacter flavus]
MEKMSHCLETFANHATIITEQKRTADPETGPRGGGSGLKLDRIDIGLDMHRQLGTLCWKRKNNRVRILLITSRETGRWVIPKGWPKDGVSDPDMAAREAWEEAGVTGAVAPAVIGTFDYAKIVSRELKIEVALPCRVEVYPMEVSDLARKYPEAKQRKRGWFSPMKAASLVNEPQLSELIAAFEPA